MTASAFTIGELARRFALARSTLLYCDRIGLLCPRGRSQGNYRLYSAADVERLTKIRHYRAAGLSLGAIAELLREEDAALRSVLEERLFAINAEIAALHEQQALILKLLQLDGALLRAPVLTQAVWVAMLEAAGLDATGRQRWHQEFERRAPDAHQRFLVSLGIAPEEVTEIRAWSRKDGCSGP
jgi:DNA-binding transcriptional MerR regulator